MSRMTIASDVAALPSTGFGVDYLQACEPEALTAADGIVVILQDEADNMGFPRVGVYGPTREAVIDYVREQWGDDDSDWFAEYVVGRVTEVFAVTLTDEG